MLGVNMPELRRRHAGAPLDRKPHREHRLRQALQALAHGAEDGVVLGFLGLEGRVDQDQGAALDRRQQGAHRGVPVAGLGLGTRVGFKCRGERRLLAGLQLAGDQSILRTQRACGQQR